MPCRLEGLTLVSVTVLATGLQPLADEGEEREEPRRLSKKARPRGASSQRGCGRLGTTRRGHHGLSRRIPWPHPLTSI
jgi:hypothetical protein